MIDAEAPFITLLLKIGDCIHEPEKALEFFLQIVVLVRRTGYPDQYKPFSN